MGKKKRRKKQKALAVLTSMLKLGLSKKNLVHQD